MVTPPSRKAAPQSCFPVFQTIQSAILLRLFFLSALSAQEQFKTSNGELRQQSIAVIRVFHSFSEIIQAPGLLETGEQMG